ncbi:MAG TPA: hypothetical protein VN673_19225, partial [Clostridia bacterium]|nr:hypothetical protein [Clostridia bacterium]
ARPQGKPDWQQLAKLKFNGLGPQAPRTRWNFSPWADFRSYMDTSLASVLADLRQAARELDPETPVGIEGTQMPHAFGGYDLYKLARAVDWVEPYDIGHAREIFGSFMPAAPLMTTVFEQETQPARRRLWHLLLEGDKGCIIWWSEDCLDWKSPGLPLTAKGKALAPVLKELTSPLAQRFLQAERVRDPVFIHYSQPSIQIDWLLESTVDGSSWLRRFSSYESGHNHMARVRNGWVKVLQDLGFSPQFVSSEQIEQGALQTNQAAVLVLPGSLGLSGREAREIQALHERGGVVFSDGVPGWFDEHGKLQERLALEDLFPARTWGATNATTVFAVSKGKQPAMRVGDMAQYAAERMQLEPNLAWLDWVAKQLGDRRPEVVVPPTTRTRVHRLRFSEGQLLAFERNINYHMSEDLKQAGGNEALEKPVQFEAKLGARKHVYDLRALRYLGRTDRIQINLSGWTPALFGATDREVPMETFTALPTGK